VRIGAASVSIGALSATLAGAVACGEGSSVETRTVTIHAPRLCAPGKAPFGLFDPFGDFPLSPSVSLSLGTPGAALAGIPQGTRELVVSVTDAADVTHWTAHGAIAPSGAIELLALPFGSPCTLTDAVDPRTTGALGVVDAGHVLVVGGKGPLGVPRTALVDLTRGVVSELAGGLLVPRMNATVTASGVGAVVAGGTRPDTGETLASFEIYASSAGDFDGATYALGQARARHGAAVMASGETLLVGGVDPSGKVLGSMEAIDAVKQRARTGGLGSLAVPRADPFVLRLASGEILVAGGVGASGAAVTTLEWFSPDGSAPVGAVQDLFAAPSQAFIPLGAGGALAVIAPVTPSVGFQNVWVLSADHGLEPATPIDGALTEVRLFDGTDGAPVLWTGDRWLVWQPWAGSFASLLPAIGAAGPSGDPIASPEPGLGVWTDGSEVHALRFGARGPYFTTATSSPLLLEDTAETAPDRLVLAGTPGAVTFDPTTGLTLQPRASVFVTDATFGSFAFDAETPGKLPPAIVLRDETGVETVLDGTACAIVPGTTIHLERDADSVLARTAGGALSPCSRAPAAGARVAIGLRGGASGAVVRSVVVTRQ
jgi:hypothetical protein